MSGESILVVDDDRKNLEVVSIHVTNAGYLVDVAQDGEEALEKFLKKPIIKHELLKKVRSLLG